MPGIQEHYPEALNGFRSLRNFVNNAFLIKKVVKQVLLVIKVIYHHNVLKLYKCTK